MQEKTKLVFIKTTHTLVWIIMAFASFFILYSGIAKKTSSILWICIGLLAAETLVLVLNKWTCPMTPMAMKYTANRQANFDIYLPLVVAKYNKWIFGSIFVVGLGLVIKNML